MFTFLLVNAFTPCNKRSTKRNKDRLNMDKFTAADATAENIAYAMVTLDQMPPSREASLVKTKLQEAMMWLNSAKPARNETDG